MMKWLLVLLALFAMSASAADVTGTWKGSLESPQGSMDVTFTFKAAGTTLTGSVSNPMGPDANPISEGKIDGDNISFVVAVDFGGQGMKINYKGKVISATEMTLSMSFPGMGGGDPMTMEIKAKKAN
jgi:hypothetical protein